MKVLLIEDDLDIGVGIQRALQQRAMEVIWVRTWTAAHALANAQAFNLAVLDLSLPDGDGLTWLRDLRDGGGIQPVLILSGRDWPSDRLEGLRLGADDFLTKPFSLQELLARLGALSRRAPRHARVDLTSSGLYLDADAHRVYQESKPIHLSPTEFKIVQLLMSRRGRVVPREAIEEQALSREYAGSLDMHMSNLRKKLGRQTIRTIRGIGFIIDRE